MAGVGRPRKDKSEKVEYQHIAVHTRDYLIFLDKSEEAKLKKVEAFHDMVKNYNPKKKQQ